MKLIFWLHINTDIFFQLIVSLWVCIARHVQRRKATGLYNILAISQGKSTGWSWFLPADNCQRFLQSDTIIARHAQITQNKKVAISVQYRKKEVNDEVNLLKVDTIILMGMVKHFQSSQNSTFAMSLQYLQKKLEIKLIFYKQINIKVAYKLIYIIWGPMFPTRWYYHYWWAWWNIVKVLQVTSLQIVAISQKRS